MSRRTSRATTTDNDDVESSEEESDGDDNNDNSSNAPSLRSIMRSSNKSNGKRTSSQKAFITKNVQEHDQDKIGTGELALIDTGADTCVMGPAFKIISETGCYVDMVGAEPGMIKEDLQLGTGLTLATLSNGEHVILCFNESIINDKSGKSILSVNQMRHHQNEVNEKPKVFGGLQNIVMLDDDELPLTYKHALTWLDISYPTEEDLDKYHIIEVTSDMPWDPNDAGKRPITPMTKKKPPDIEELRPCLGWKPEQVVRKTVDATTQYASNNLCLPMHQHFKAWN